MCETYLNNHEGLGQLPCLLHAFDRDIYEGHVRAIIIVVPVSFLL